MDITTIYWIVLAVMGLGVIGAIIPGLPGSSNILRSELDLPVDPHGHRSYGHSQFAAGDGPVHGDESHWVAPHGKLPVNDGLAEG